MKLEEAIKQKKFKNAYHKLNLNLIYSGGLLLVEQTRFFKSYDISPQQYNVLRILRGQHPNAASVGLIQERMLDQMSNASRLIEKLKLKGFLTRTACEADRRQVDVVITKEGLDLLGLIDHELETIYQNFGALSLEEAELLNNLLDKLNGNKEVQ